MLQKSSCSSLITLHQSSAAIYETPIEARGVRTPAHVLVQSTRAGTVHTCCYSAHVLAHVLTCWYRAHVLLQCTRAVTVHASWYSAHLLVQCTRAVTVLTCCYSAHLLLQCSPAVTVHTCWYSAHVLTCWYRVFAAASTPASTSRPICKSYAARLG